MRELTRWSAAVRTEAAIDRKRRVAPEAFAHWKTVWLCACTGPFLAGALVKPGIIGRSPRAEQPVRPEVFLNVVIRSGVTGTQEWRGARAVPSSASVW
jgi:hypothetical protein